jgi:hypothetical protein
MIMMINQKALVIMVVRRYQEYDMEHGNCAITFFSSGTRVISCPPGITHLLLSLSDILLG